MMSDLLMQRMSLIGATRHTLPLPSRTFSMRPAAESEVSALLSQPLCFLGQSRTRPTNSWSCRGHRPGKNVYMLTAGGGAGAIRLGGRQ